jgi:hypothetical protein
MKNSGSRRSAWAVPLMLFVALGAMGAVTSRSPSTTAIDGRCHPPQVLALVPTVAQQGKARPGVPRALVALPVGTPRKQAHHVSTTGPESAVTYVRCEKRSA